MNLTLSGNVGFKVLGIGVLVLLMLIPLAQVEGLVQERAARAADAARQIALRWGDAQAVAGAVVVVPVQRTIETLAPASTAAAGETAARTMRRVEDMHYVLPEELVLHARLQPELRSYGLYTSVVYLAELKVEGHFSGADLAVFARDGGEPQWQRAQLRVPIADVHGIRRASPARIGALEREFGPSAGGVAGSAAIMLPFPELARVASQPKLPFSFELTLAGSERLSVVPLARKTTAHIEGAWSDPGFDGDFLPARREVDAAGFNADWQVLDLNRRLPQHWVDDGTATLAAPGGDFGVSLLRTANPYQRNTRAGKYGVLFVVFTFTAFFLFEVLRGLRLHPLQYLLVGAALCMFYVLLLALSEHVGFAAAYAVAATTIAVVLGGYAASALRQRRIGLGLGGLIGLVYLLLYGLISSEDYALLMGALALLAALAAVMLLTRKVDWYRQSER